MYFGDAPIRAGHYRNRQWLQQCDVRSESTTVAIARSAFLRDRRFGVYYSRGFGHSPVQELAAFAVHSTTRTAIEGHLSASPRAKGAKGIYYVGNVLSEAPLLDPWRDQFPCTVVTWQRGRRTDISVAQLLVLNEVVVSMWFGPHDPLARRDPPPVKQHPSAVNSIVPIVSTADVPSFARDRLIKKIHNMNLIGLEASEDLWLLHFSTDQTAPGFYRSHHETPGWVVPVDLKGGVLFDCRDLGEGGTYFILLARDHDITRWLALLREHAKIAPTIVVPEHVEAAWLAASKTWWRLPELIKKWSELPTIPTKVKPRIQLGKRPNFNGGDLFCRRTVTES